MRLQLIPGIHRTTHRISMFLDATEPPLEITQGEAHLLTHLLESPKCTVGQLHEAFAHKRSTLTSYLDRLEDKKLVTRQTHREDRRSFLVTLTPAGRALARRVHGRVEMLEDAVLARVSERDLRGFQAVLHVLQEHSPQAADAAAPTRRTKP